MAATSQGLVRIGFGYMEENEDMMAELAEVSNAVGQGDPAWLDEPFTQLREYFEGRRHRFDLAVDWRLTHGFYRRVLDALMTVDYGTTVSYGELARMAGSSRAARAVGTAMSTNPIPLVVPCHRVVRSGRIGGGVRWPSRGQDLAHRARARPPPLMARLSKLERSVAGRVAVVTGGGLRDGTGHRMAVGRRGGQGSRAGRQPLRSGRDGDRHYRSGRHRTGVGCDLSDPEVIEPVVAQVRAELGAVDILINNAGIAAGAPVDDADYEDAWAVSLDVNLTAQVRLVRACLDDLKRNGDGRIVNVASTEGVMATPNNSPYTVSKHGVVGLTRALAVELGQWGVTANAICPGPIRTAMTGGIPDEAKQKYARRRVPARRYGDPEEVAQVTLSLVLPAASFINGAVVLVDGGLHAKSN